jgi:hypothetical protein
VAVPGERATELSLRARLAFPSRTALWDRQEVQLPPAMARRDREMKAS